MSSARRGSVLPHSPDAERGVLGAVLIEEERLDELSAVLAPEDLYGDDERRIYRAMLGLRDKGQSVDPTTVAAATGLDAGHIGDLLENIPRPANVASYVAAIRDCARRRRQARLANDLRDAALSGQETSELEAAIAETAAQAAAEAAPCHTMRELMEDPSIMRPPAVVASRLAWRGMSTLLAAPEFGGKSTLLGAVQAAVTRGAPWLDGAHDDGPAQPADVLLVTVDEAVSTSLQRLSDWSADPDRVHVVHDLQAVRDPIAAVAGRAATIHPALIVVDNLGSIAQRWQPESGSAMAWASIMHALVRIARDMDAAQVLLHHTRKIDGRYRDSTAIGAAVDVLIEMAEGRDPTERKMRVRARWDIQDYAVRLTTRGYEVAHGALPLEDRIIEHVMSHPGCSLRGVRQGVRGSPNEIGPAVEKLKGTGRLENRGGDRAMKLYVPDGEAEGPIPPSETPDGGELVSGTGTAPGTTANTAGTRPNEETGTPPGGETRRVSPVGTASSAETADEVPEAEEVV